uniref:Putative chaperonin n=1 Tax=viral metagenome TaxID=1070528 RepID=A0A6M3J1K4_9ZZZZ
MLTPMKNKVLIERIEQPLSKVIIQPDNYKTKSLYGKVIAVGNEVKDIPVDCNVFFQGYSGAELNWNECKCVMINEEDVFCIDKGVT